MVFQLLDSNHGSLLREATTLFFFQLPIGNPPNKYVSESLLNFLTAFNREPFCYFLVTNLCVKAKYNFKVFSYVGSPLMKHRSEIPSCI